MSSKPTTRALYQCTKCKAKDSTPLYANESAPPALVCYACHAGLHMDTEQQIMQRKGMLLVGTEPIPPEYYTHSAMDVPQVAEKLLVKWPAS